jgi:hypothetical protein
MDLLQIFLIFMISTSLTLAGFVIRQRKNNRMLGELVAQNKVSVQDRYAKLNVGMKNQENVSRCPSCAEWINLEAKVCKSCQQSVEEHNLAKKEAMKLLDQEAKELRIAGYIKKRQQLRAIRSSKFFRLSVAVLLLIILFFAVTNIASTLKYKRATAMPSSVSALRLSWDSAVTDCRQYGVAVHPTSKISYEQGLFLVFSLPSNVEDFDWDSSLGKEIICFSEKALGVNVSKKLNLFDSKDIELQNNFSISAYPEKQYVGFYWRPAS